MAVAAVAAPTLVAWLPSATAAARSPRAAAVEIVFLLIAWGLTGVLEWRMGKRDAVKSDTVGA